MILQQDVKPYIINQSLQRIMFEFESLTAQYKTLLVIWVHGLIFPLKVYIFPSHFDREYESMYPVKNPFL
jgi:hypothetical protein